MCLAIKRIYGTNKFIESKRHFRNSDLWLLLHFLFRQRSWMPALIIVMSYLPGLNISCKKEITFVTFYRLLRKSETEQNQLFSLYFVFNLLTSMYSMLNQPTFVFFLFQNMKVVINSFVRYADCKIKADSWDYNGAERKF